MTFKAKLRVLNNTVDEFAQGRLKRSQEELGRGPSCRKGCTHCCYMTVTASLPEAMGALLELDRLGKAEEWAEEKKDQIIEDAILVQDPKMTTTNWFDAKRPCAFLDQERDECMVYAFRPHACRAYYVFSPAEDCGGGSGKRVLVSDATKYFERILPDLDRLSAEVGLPTAYSPMPYLIPIALMILNGQVKEGLRLLAMHGAYDLGAWLERWGRYR